MRAKKQLSKRKSTRLDVGIKKKAAAHRRKQKKLAKNDPTWKSRKPKDPGIPNSFPYKAQMLEEIEQQKLKDLEERERRRELQRQSAFERGLTEEQVESELKAIDSESRQDRLAALMASAQEAQRHYDGEDDVDMDSNSEGDSDEDLDEEDEIDFRGQLDYSGKYEDTAEEGSRRAFDKIFKEVVDASDVILYVVDSRNPEGTRSKQVEREVLANHNKRLIYVMNKIDLVPADMLKKWKTYLELYFPTVPMAASSSAPNARTFKHGTANQVTTANALLQVLKKYAHESNLKRAISVGVIGYPNVGKSSIINALCARHGNNSKSSCPVGAQAGVTTSIRKIKLDGKLNILDSPGVVFPSDSTKNKKVSAVDRQAKLILLNSVPPKQIKDPRPAVSLLLKRLLKNPEQYEMLKEYYDLPEVVKNPHDQFVTAFLVHVSRKMGRLKRKGIADLDGAGIQVLTDWRDGRISGWAHPPAEPKDLPVESDLVIKKVGGSGSVVQKQIVTEWAQEFSLEGLWDGTFEGDE